MKKIFACPNFKRMLEIEKLKSLAMFGVVDGMGRVCSHEIGGIGLMTHKGVCAVCKSYIRRKG